MKNYIDKFKKSKWYWKALLIVIVILTFSAIVCTIVYSNWSDAVSTISTLFLVITAVITAIFAFYQLSEYRREQRNQMLLSIIEKMSSERERENRAIIFQLPEDIKNDIDSHLVRKEVLTKIGLFHNAQIMRPLSSDEIETMKSLRINEAIEETVSCLERAGFFLNENKDLRGDAPKWIYDVINNMREILQSYIQKRRAIAGQEGYGKILLEFKLPVTLVEKYNPDWTKWFEQIKLFLGDDIIRSCLRVEHVGSTSVPGMIAKPIIDLILVIAPDDFEKVKNLLAIKGYQHEGDLGIIGREAFKIPDDKLRQSLPQHHLYVCARDSIELKKQVAFREFLKNHTADAQCLSGLKWELAERYNNDREAYIQGKDALCKEITKKALDE